MDYVTTTRAAQLIGISREAVRLAITRGALKAVKFGDVWQVELQSVLSYKRRYQPKP